LVHLWHESEIPAERPNWSLLQGTESSDRIEAMEGLREVATTDTGMRESSRRAGAYRRAS